MLQRKLHGRYLLKEELGQGGMGRVYRAQDTLLDRAVAVKVLTQFGLDGESRRRLLVEARAAARLNHPNVVAVYDAGEDGDTPFLVMELLAGQSLDAAGALSFERLLEVGIDVCRALDHAHAHGIIHRDLKPQNIFITAEGQVKLFDFGLARIEAGSRLTQKGTILGTFTYMAPELLVGGAPSPQSDLYSLGVVLYELATGRGPFTADTIAALLYQSLHATVAPPSAHNAGVPPDFDRLLLALLEKEAEARPATAQAAMASLHALQQALPPAGQRVTAPSKGAEDDLLEIQLFGGFRLIYRGQPHQELSQPRLQALLAYLLLKRSAPQSRQQLAYLFWPESTDRQARTNLRKALYRLRHNLPAFERCLALDEQQVQWRAAAPFTLDVAVFEEALERAGQATDPAAERRHLEEALAYYQGQLLPDCYDDWLIAERERLHALSRGARLRLIQHLEAERAYEAAIAQAQLLLADDPLEEEACRVLMRLHLLNGDRARALQVYQAFAADLEQEVGAPPAAATRQLFRQILAEETSAVRPPAADAGPGRPPLIGRKQQWSRLHHAWQEVVVGKSLLALIEGEAGIGKTHLAESFLAWGEQLGVRTAIAHCYEGGGLAFEPLVAWLRTPHIRAAMAALDAVWLREISRLLPELAAERPELADVAPIVESWQRQRLFEALVRALLAAEEPLLLLLDDLQWSDLETLEWLQYLLRVRQSAPLLVLCTFRPEGLEPDHPSYSFRRHLQLRGQLLELELPRLDEDETAALAQAVFGRNVPAGSLEQLYTETEGSPLLIVESARAAQSRPGVAAPPVDAMTPRVQAVIESRLARLSPGAQALAALAAVIGRDFTFDVLEEAGEAGTEALLAHLDELSRHQVIEERRSSGEERYHFTHDKLRQVTYEQLAAARRRLLHRRVAEALERVYAGQPQAFSGEIGRHFEQARVFPRALTYYEQAAAQASRLYAYHDAQRLYERAIAVAVRLNQPGEQVTRLHQQRGRMLEHAGKFEEAIGVYRDLERLARSRWDREMECVAITHLVDCFVKPDAGHNRAGAEPLIERGLQLARTVQAPEQEAHLLWSKMVHATHYGHTAAARAAGEACVALCREHGLQKRLGLTLHDLSLNLRLNGALAEGNRYAAEARALFRKMENLPMLVDSLNQQALFDYLQLDLQAALATAAEAAAISKRIDNGWNLAYAAWIQGMVQEARGLWDSAVTFWEESLRYGKESGFLMAMTTIPLQLGLLWLHLGEGERARQLITQALATGEATAPFILQAAKAASAIAAFAAGEVVAGLRWAEQAQAQQPEGDIATALLLPLPARALVEAAVHAEEEARWAAAREAVEAAFADARRRKLEAHEVTLGYLRGVTLKAGGDLDAAASQWQATLVTARRLHLTPLLLDVAAALSALHRESGEKDEAERYRIIAQEALTGLSGALQDRERRRQFIQAAERRLTSN